MTRVCIPGWKPSWILQPLAHTDPSYIHDKLIPLATKTQQTPSPSSSLPFTHSFKNLATFAEKTLSVQRLESQAGCSETHLSAWSDTEPYQGLVYDPSILKYEFDKSHRRVFGSQNNLKSFAFMHELCSTGRWNF